MLDRKNANTIALRSSDLAPIRNVAIDAHYPYVMCNLITGVGDAKGESISIHKERNNYYVLCYKTCAGNNKTTQKFLIMSNRHNTI